MENRDRPHKPPSISLSYRRSAPDDDEKYSNLKDVPISLGNNRNQRQQSVTINNTSTEGSNNKNIQRVRERKRSNPAKTIAWVFIGFLSLVGIWWLAASNYKSINNLEIERYEDTKVSAENYEKTQKGIEIGYNNDKVVESGMLEHKRIEQYLLKLKTNNYKYVEEELDAKIDRLDSLDFEESQKFNLINSLKSIKQKYYPSSGLKKTEYYKKDHIVREKENCYRLAKSYNVNVEDIITWNPNVYSEEQTGNCLLKVGEKIFIYQKIQGEKNKAVESSPKKEIVSEKKMKIKEPISVERKKKKYTKPKKATPVSQAVYKAEKYLRDTNPDWYSILELNDVLQNLRDAPFEKGIDDMIEELVRFKSLNFPREFPRHSYSKLTFAKSNVKSLNHLISKISREIEFSISKEKIRTDILLMYPEYRFINNIDTYPKSSITIYLKTKN